MIITFFHFPAPGMGSLLKDSFGKEVGKRKWCETFAGPLIRRLSRSGGLSFIFSKEMLIFCVFFGAFRALPSTKKTQKHTKKKHNSYHKKTPWKKKHKSYHKKTIHITKEIKKHTNHTRKNTKNKHNSYHKKTQKNKVIFLFVSASVSVFFCFFSVFFPVSFLLLFCFWKIVAFKAFSSSQPGPVPAPPLSQPAPQASSPPTPSAPPSPRLSPQAQSSSPGLLYVLYTHSLLFCYRRCDGQHPKP